MPDDQLPHASHIFRPAELRKRPTLATGQCCSLKIDYGNIRVWLCRVGGGVTVESLMGDRWVKTSGGCHDTGGTNE